MGCGSKVARGERVSGKERDNYRVHLEIDEKKEEILYSSEILSLNKDIFRVLYSNYCTLCFFFSYKLSPNATV